MKIIDNIQAPVITGLIRKNQYRPQENVYRATELVGPPLIRLLKLHRWDDIVLYASEFLWSLSGSMLHETLRQAAPMDSLNEEKLTVTYEGITIAGTPDLYFQTGVIEDYKFTSVYSFILGEKIDWMNQVGKVYPWLLRKHGFPVTQGVIRAILRDWVRSKTYKDPNYPRIPFQSVKVPIASERESETYVLERLMLHMEASKNWQEGEELAVPLCTPEERWYRGETWAVMKEGLKTAVRVLDTEEKALQFIGNIVPKANSSNFHFIEYRPGVNKRCLEFCPVRYLCQRNPEKTNLEEAPHDTR